MEKEKILMHLDNALEEQVPDAWDQIEFKLSKEPHGKTVIIPRPFTPMNNKRKLRRVSFAAAAFLIAVTAFTFTPARAAIQELYDKLFASEHIDDKGLKTLLADGQGQAIGQTYHDEKNDITVHFQSVMTDDKETKLLFTYQSEKTDLKNYYVDIFEGESSVSLIDAAGKKKKLENVGWGSRYYDPNENKVAEALSFAPIKEFAGQEVRLQIENLTNYDENDEQYKRKIETVWPVAFKLNKSAVYDRETMAMDKEFSFNGETYKIVQVEYSEFETRVVTKGTDIKPYIDEEGKEYDTMSKLENQLLNARKFEKGKGYIVNEKKSGVFLKANGKRIDPIFNKNELPGPLDEYIMVFEPIKDRQDVTLEVGEEIKIPLNK